MGQDPDRATIASLDPGHLFHVSEAHDIKLFHPRPPPAPEVGQIEPCVWAIAHAFLANYLLPRDCPRVVFGLSSHTTRSDAERFIGNSTASRIVVIERGWRFRADCTPLSLYAFPRTPQWRLFDENCGVHVSTETTLPVGRYAISSPSSALIAMGAELREVDNLWPLIDAVVQSSLNFSIIRKRNALPAPPAFQ